MISIDKNRLRRVQKQGHVSHIAENTLSFRIASEGRSLELKAERGIQSLQ